MLKQAERNLDLHPRVAWSRRDVYKRQLLFYSFSPKVMVGTDIVHAVILTGVTSLLHFRLHNIDP